MRSNEYAKTKYKMIFEKMKIYLKGHSANATAFL
jgi:hypothetical protein